MGGQKVFWKWKGPYYLPAILTVPLLSSESGSQHGSREWGWGAIREPATSASLPLTTGN